MTDESEVWSLLDSAIAEVATTYYDRLTRCMSHPDKREFVNQALEELLKLQKGNSPDYNSEGTVLFYLTWYQPRQIFLAYSALRHVVRKQNPPSRIIDYGCGASAVQIASSILAAELSLLPAEKLRRAACSERSRTFPFAVHGIDPSEPMREISGFLWQNFKEKVESKVRDVNLSLSRIFQGSRGPAEHDSIFESLLDTMRSMTNSCRYPSYEAMRSHRRARHASAPDDCWLTAVHVAYESNLPDMEAVFRRIRKEQEPSLEMVTFSRGSDTHLKRQNFFREHGFEEEVSLRLPVPEGNVLMPEGDEIVPKENRLGKTTDWRCTLVEMVEDEKQRLLYRDVEWVVPSVANVVMIRNKNETR